MRRQGGQLASERMWTSPWEINGAMFFIKGQKWAVLGVKKLCRLSTCALEKVRKIQQDPSSRRPLWQPRKNFIPSQFLKTPSRHSRGIDLRYSPIAIFYLYVGKSSARVHLLAWNFVLLFVLRISWNAFWNPTACWVGLSKDLTLLTKVDIFLFVSLVAGDRNIL